MENSSENDGNRVTFESRSDAPSPSSAVAIYDKTIFSTFYEDNRTFTFGDTSIRIFQEWVTGGVAAVVWDAAIVMCTFMSQAPQLVKNKAVLELGAGTGLAGICAAKFGADVTFTDRKQALKVLDKNVKANLGEAAAMAVTELEWGSPLGPRLARHWDIVVGTDIVYVEDTFDALRGTLVDLDSTIIYLSCRLRYDKDLSFLHKLKNDFLVELTLHDVSAGVHIYALTRL